MSKPNVASIWKSVRGTLSKHSPEILTGIGIAGMVTGTILAVKATPKALRLIEAKKEELLVDELTPAQTVKATWKCYIPTAITIVSSTACLIGASSVNARRNAALATAYKLAETTLTEYKEKVIETIGERKEQAIREEIRKDHLEENPESKHDVIITGDGDTLCYDSVAGRYFTSDINKIKSAINNINFKLLREDYASLNDFYDELNLKHSSLGDDLGWNVVDGKVDINFSSHITDTGKPCLVIDYSIAPNYEYSRYC